MKTIIIVLLSITLISVTIVGCGSGNSSSKIIGQWKIVELSFNRGPDNSAVGKLGVEFFSDKTYQMPNMPGSGTWTILEDGRIKMQDRLGGGIIFARLQGDILILTLDGIFKMTCKR